MNSKVDRKTMPIKQDEAASSCHALLTFVGDRVDPDELMSLIPLKRGRAGKKGDRIGRAGPDGTIPLARTGYCNFSTHGIESSSDINLHVAILLKAVRPNAAAIEGVIRDRELKCEIVCFFSDLQRKKTWKITDINERLSHALRIPIVNESVSETVTYAPD